MASFSFNYPQSLLPCLQILSQAEVLWASTGTRRFGGDTTHKLSGFMCEIGVMANAGQTPELPGRWTSGHVWGIILIVLTEMERLAHYGLCHSLAGTLSCVNQERDLSSLCFHHCLLPDCGYVMTSCCKLEAPIFSP